MAKKVFLMSFLLSAVLLLQLPVRCFADAQSQFDTAEKYYDQYEHAKAEQAYQAALDNWPDADCAIWAQASVRPVRTAPA